MTTGSLPLRAVPPLDEESALSTTDVRILVPVEEDVGSKVPERELQERREREEERRGGRRRGSWVLGGRNRFSS